MPPSSTFKTNGRRRLKLALIPTIAQGIPAAGAFSGELAARYIAEHYYHVDLSKPGSELTEDERQQLSLMSTLAAGLAGGLAGNSTAAATTGAQAGKNAVENNSLSGEDAQEKNSIELALSKTGLALHPRTPEEVAELEARHEQLVRLDAEIDKYAQDACAKGKASDACQDANALLQSLKESYNGYVGQLTYRDLNREDYAKVSEIVANTSADKWDYAIEGYAKSQNISYQEAKDKFAIAVNINRMADVAAILYGLNGSGAGKAAVSGAAATLKTVLSKYDEFKQNIAASKKGNNDALAIAGAGNVSGSPAGNGLSSNAYLSTGTGGNKGNSVPVKDPVTVNNGAGLINEGSQQIPAKAKDTQIWTETKKKDPVSNAFGHWEKHKSEFPEYQNSKQYVEATHSFVTKPPTGTLVKTRPNGDILYYNPATNTFASKDASGIPRTMFKPEKGMEYWNKQ